LPYSSSILPPSPPDTYDNVVEAANKNWKKIGERTSVVKDKVEDQKPVSKDQKPGPKAFHFYATSKEDPIIAVITKSAGIENASMGSCCEKCHQLPCNQLPVVHITTPSPFFALSPSSAVSNSPKREMMTKSPFTSSVLSTTTIMLETVKQPLVTPRRDELKLLDELLAESERWAQHFNNLLCQQNQKNPSELSSSEPPPFRSTMKPTSASSSMLISHSIEERPCRCRRPVEDNFLAHPSLVSVLPSTCYCKSVDDMVESNKERINKKNHAQTSSALSVDNGHDDANLIVDDGVSEEIEDKPENASELGVAAMPEPTTADQLCDIWMTTTTQMKKNGPRDGRIDEEEDYCGGSISSRGALRMSQSHPVELQRQLCSAEASEGFSKKLPLETALATAFPDRYRRRRWKRKCQHQSPHCNHHFRCCRCVCRCHQQQWQNHHILNETYRNKVEALRPPPKTFLDSQHIPESPKRSPLLRLTLQRYRLLPHPETTV
jgi:putative sterol carrier protein